MPGGERRLAQRIKRAPNAPALPKPLTPGQPRHLHAESSFLSVSVNCLCLLRLGSEIRHRRAWDVARFERRTGQRRLNYCETGPAMDGKRGTRSRHPQESQRPHTPFTETLRRLGSSRL